MTPHSRIARSAGFAVVTTLVSLECVSLVSGIDVPPVYWAVATLCPLILSTVISGRLIRQSDQINQLYVELQRTHEQLKVAAQRDPLTDALNRGAFLTQIAELRGNGIAGWLVLIDVDHFKVINDRHGHETGDEALRQITRLLREAARADDLIGRLGGEEFGLYLPRTSTAEAWALTERVRQHVAQSTAYTVNGRPHRVTISLGLAIERCPAESLKDILHRADMAMYRAKDEGRNRIAAAA